MTDFEAFLLSFAERNPAGAMERTRRAGLRAGYPVCCVEFYVSLIPVLWDGVLPELEAWWQADPGHGYVRCPRCRAVRMTRPALPGAREAVRPCPLASLPAPSSARRRSNARGRGCARLPAMRGL
jgi:hypothetical protein